MAVAALPDTLIDELVAICGDDHVFTGKSALYNRARVPSPFPVHRWNDYIPQAVVLPTTAEQISEVVKLANRHRVPVVPRAGGTGLTDGAVPLKHGILVDVKLMNRILEIDVEDRTVTVQPGINMLKLSEELKPLGFIYPGRSRLLPVLARRRPDRDQRLVADRQPLRPHPRSRDLVRASCSRQARSSASATAAAGRSGSPCPATSWTPLHGPSGYARDRHGGDARAREAPRGGVLGVLRVPGLPDAWRATAELARSGRRDARRGRSVRRVEARVPAARRRGVHPAAGLGQGRRGRGAYGNADEVRVGAKRLLRIGKESGGTYLGDEISQGDWASRHDRYATPLHGRTRSGQVVIDELALRGRCDPPFEATRGGRALACDRGRPARALRHVRRLGDVRVHERGLQAVGRLPHRDRHRHLGAAVGTKSTGRRGSTRNARSREVAIESGGSISSLSRARAAKARSTSFPLELGGGFEVMKTIKKGARPEQRHESWEVPTRRGLRGGGAMIGFRLAAQRPRIRRESRTA